MPELPEVETVRQTLRQVLLGHQIQTVDVLWPRMIEDDIEHFQEILKGQTFREIDRYGKYLIFLLDDVAFISHLRMEGKYYYVSSAAPIDKHTHVLFHLDQNMDLRYHDVRKFGRFCLTDREKYRTLLPLAKLGKEPFDWNAEDLHEAFSGLRAPIKVVLLDQTIIAGLGNIYANEVLYRSGIHPLSPAGDLSVKKVKALLQAACQVLQEAIAQGGTTIRSFEVNGIHGLFAVALDVYHKEGQMCPRCGHVIRQKKIQGRSTFYCPHCQKLIRKRRKKS